MDKLKISCLQVDLVWENPAANLERIEGYMDSGQSADLWLLPELFTTGFSITNKLLAEPMQGKSVNWMLTMAKKTNSHIAGSMLVHDNGHMSNRLIWASPLGLEGWYDKRHLFRMAGENNYLKGGSTSLIVTLQGWKVMPLICYDLRFPVWARNTYNKGVFGYDILTYHANWPEARSYAWKQLLIARAIENQAYVIGVNRCGKDGNGIQHAGDTVVIDFKGQVLAQMPANSQGILEVELSLDALTQYRSAFAAMLDWDKFEICN
jgi:omega-amidase